MSMRHLVWLVVAATLVACVPGRRTHLTTAFDELRTQRGGEFIRPFGTTAFHVSDYKLPSGRRVQAIRLNLVPGQPFNWHQLKAELHSLPNGDRPRIEPLYVLTRFPVTRTYPEVLEVTPSAALATRANTAAAGSSWQQFFGVSSNLAAVLQDAVAARLPVGIDSVLTLRDSSGERSIVRLSDRVSQRAPSVEKIEGRAIVAHVQVPAGQRAQTEVRLASTTGSAQDRWWSLRDAAQWEVLNVQVDITPAVPPLQEFFGASGSVEGLADVSRAVLDSLAHMRNDSTHAAIGVPVEVYLACVTREGARACLRAGQSWRLRLTSGDHAADYDFRLVSRNPVGSFLVGLGLLGLFLWYVGSG